MAGKNWFEYPGKTHLAVFFTIWMVGNFFSILAITELFTESLIQKGYYLNYLLMFMATASVIKLWSNFKSKPTRPHK